MNSDFRELLRLLTAHKVRHLIIGGHAVMFYTEPRYTKDLDVAIGGSPDDFKGFVQAIEEFGFPMTDDQKAAFAQPNKMIVLGRPPARIDVLNCVEGVDFEQAWTRRTVVELDGVELNFIAREDMILA